MCYTKTRIRLSLIRHFFYHYVILNRLSITPLRAQRARIAWTNCIYPEPSTDVCLLTHIVSSYPCPPRAANISWKGNWRCKSFSITSSHLGSPGARSSSYNGTAGVTSGSRRTEFSCKDSAMCTQTLELHKPQTCPGSAPGVPCY